MWNCSSRPFYRDFKLRILQFDVSEIFQKIYKFMHIKIMYKTFNMTKLLWKKVMVLNFC
jgi:hypothetical protein